MASLASVRHHRWSTQAAWANKELFYTLSQCYFFSCVAKFLACFPKHRKNIKPNGIYDGMILATYVEAGNYIGEQVTEPVDEDKQEELKENCRQAYQQMNEEKIRR